jgi:DNA topoisomerase-2
MNITENFLELVDIDDIILEDEYTNMVDISVDVEQSFLLSNGLISHNSASSAFRKYRDPQIQGAFSLRGKFINAAEINTQKLTANNEVINLMGCFGLKLGQKATKESLRYGKLLIYTDSDFDGSAIAALLINFLHKYWPELFVNNMIYKAETPIVVSKNLKSKKKISFYTPTEYNDWLVKVNPKDWEIEYKKGLAALIDDEYHEIINHPKLTLITTDDLSKNYLNVWFGKDSENRKLEILK